MITLSSASSLVPISPSLLLSPPFPLPFCFFNSPVLHFPSSPPSFAPYPYLALPLCSRSPTPPPPLCQALIQRSPLLPYVSPSSTSFPCFHSCPYFYFSPLFPSLSPLISLSPLLPLSPLLSLDPLFACYSSSSPSLSYSITYIPNSLIRISLPLSPLIPY